MAASEVIETPSPDVLPVSEKLSIVRPPLLIESRPEAIVATVAAWSPSAITAPGCSASPPTAW